jgi:FPC/CPF motif-containing protein YcgG
MLLRLSSLRQQREAHTLAEADKPLRRTLAELRRAQQELARQTEHVAASERGSFSVLQQPETLGRDIARAFAARAERQALLAAQIEYLAVCARRNQEAQRAFDDARLRYIKAVKKHEQLLRWLQDQPTGGNS